MDEIQWSEWARGPKALRAACEVLLDGRTIIDAAQNLGPILDTAFPGGPKAPAELSSSTGLPLAQMLREHAQMLGSALSSRLILRDRERETERLGLSQCLSLLQLVELVVKGI